MYLKKLYTQFVSLGLFGCFTVLPVNGLIHSSLARVKSKEKKEVSEEYQLKINSLQSQFEGLCRQKMAEAGCVGLSYGVIHKGEIVFTNHFGSKTKGKASAISDTTVFRVGSVSKGFAGILASILIQEGKFTLEDPIHRYIPELHIRTKSVLDTITVRDVLSHTTGYIQHAFSNLVDDNVPLDRIIQAMNKYPLHDRVGKVYNYQNAAFALIEKVIENTTGLSYAQALQNYIFSPLQMNHSSATYQSITSCGDNCTGHKPSGKRGQFVSIPIKPHYYNAASAGGVNASLSDMMKWLHAVMGYNPGVISEEVRLRAFSPYIFTSNANKYFNRWPDIEESAYGLGWRILRFKDKVMVYHGGLVNGFRAEIAFDPKSEWGMVALFNSTCSYCSHIVPTFFDTKDQVFAQLDNP